MSVKLRGVGASGGVAEGSVFIVGSDADLSSFKNGSVLVTRMTNPSLVPIMLKAVAIVTDRGGLLCHAATVSRELGIPCVVGTGNATSLLKNGVRVVVDGNEGLVNEV